MLSRLTVLLLVASAVYSGGCASLSPLAPLEKSLVYHPQPLPADYPAPADAGVEEVSFAAADGVKLNGWFIDHPAPRGVALFCHGNAGNIASRAHSLQVLNQRHGLAVMTFDYRGYGKSEGKPDEEGILQDARAARRWLAARRNMREVDIILMGRSLGGAVAVDLAARDGARGLVLASTFTSLPDTAVHHVSWLPAHWLMTQRLNSLAKIGDYHGPLLYSHGDADKVVPFKLGSKLFEAANHPKRFVVARGGGHNTPESEAYRIAFEEFLSRLP